MNYRFLASRGIEKFFEESELSVGQILRAITSEKLTGVNIENRSRLSEITDQQWTEIMEKAFENETETEYFNEQQ